MTKIVLVGEAWGEKEVERGKPFQGAAGMILDAFLSAHGIARSECFITNVFNFQPPMNKILSLTGPKALGIPGMPYLQKAGKYVDAKYAPELARLYREIKEVNPNVVVALGGTATWALLSDSRIKRLRGSPSRGCTGHKVFPTYHPSAVNREYKLRPIVFSDFGKIKREAASPEIVRPTREFWLFPTTQDLLDFEPHVLSAQKLSVDVETWGRQITCVGISPRPELAIVVPFVWRGEKSGNYWKTAAEEAQAWRFIKRWVESGIPLIGQNFLYDMRYLWEKYGIRIPRPRPGTNLPPVNDTMLIHHAMQPEMEKSLALLSSLYTDEPQHKFMRDRPKDTLKQED